jgi:hypothetical protein
MEKISNHLKVCEECRSYYEISVLLLEDISDMEFEIISLDEANSSLNKIKPLILSSEKENRENRKDQKTLQTLIKKSTSSLLNISEKVSKTVNWIHTKTEIKTLPLQFDFAVRSLPESATYMQFQEDFDGFFLELFLQKWNNNNFRLYVGHEKTDKLQQNLRLTLFKDKTIVASNLVKSEFSLVGIFQNGVYDILLNNQKKSYTINSIGLTKNVNLP